MDDITIVIIGKNEEKVLKKTIDSLKSIETKKIIYVNTVGIDNSLNILKKYKSLKVINLFASNYLHTASLARNIGAKLVKTKYIQFLDADCQLNPKWLRSAKKKLQQKSIAAVVGYKREFPDINSKRFIFKGKLGQNQKLDYLGGNFLIKTKLYKKAGQFDPNLSIEEERDLYLRILKIGKKIKYLNLHMADHQDYKNHDRNLFSKLFDRKAFSFWVIFYKSLKGKYFKHFSNIYFTLIIFVLFDLLSFIIIFINYYTSVLIQFFLVLFGLFIKRPGYFIYSKSIIFSLMTNPILSSLEKKKYFKVVK